MPSWGGGGGIWVIKGIDLETSISSEKIIIQSDSQLVVG